MYMIYSFSAQEGELSSSVSYKASCILVEAADHVFDMGLDSYQVSYYATKINGVTRKLAHMTEYFLLAIAVSFPLYVYGLHGILLMLLAGGLCVAFACGDEYHQSFVSGRSPSIKDVGIDSIGVFIGIIIVRIIGWTGRMTIFRPIKKDQGQKLSRKEKKLLKQQAAQNNYSYGSTPNAPGGYYSGDPNGPGNGYNSAYQNNPYSNDLSQGYNGSGPYPGGPSAGYNGSGPYPGDPSAGYNASGPYPGGAANGYNGSGPYPGNPANGYNGYPGNEYEGQYGGPYQSQPYYGNDAWNGGQVPPPYQENGPYGRPYPYQPQAPQYMGKFQNPDESSDELSEDMPLAHLFKPKK